jgi:hypothetical protein
LHEERIAAGLAGHRGCLLGGQGALRPQERERQLLGFLGRKRVQPQLSPPGQRRVGIRRGPQPREQRAAGSVLGAIAPHKQHDRRVRRPQEFRQQLGTIDIAPLQVVNVQHQSLAVPQPGKQLAQGREGPPPQFLRVRRIDNPLVRLADRFDAPQDGKDACQTVRVARQERVGLVGGNSLQVAAERIHRAVESFVGDRFALIAAPGENDDLVVRLDLVEKPLHQGAFAVARAAVHKDHFGRAAADGVEGRVQLVQLLLAADERHGGGRRYGRRGRGLGRGRMFLQPREQLLSRHPSRWIARQQRHADFIEVFRRCRDQLARRRELFGGDRRGPQDGRQERLVAFRQLPRQGLVQHHPHAVPVRGRRQRERFGLLRRHVRERADDVPLGAEMHAALAQIGRQSEIEQDHPSLVGD